MTNDGNAGTVIVTGAARRIGRAIAEELARAGWSVAIHHRNSAVDAEAVAAGVRARGGHACAIQADLTMSGGIDHVIAACRASLGPATCLVNNASEFRYDSLDTLTPESWDAHMRINLEAPVRLAQAFARALPTGRSGNIVNIVDQRAWKLTPEYFSYTLSKAALWSATQMMAQALAPRIRVNAIGPGPVLQSVHQTDAEFAAEQAATLLGRGTDPADIARAVRFLLDAPTITGQMIALDGGQHLAWPFERPPVAGPDATAAPSKSRG